MIEIDSEIYARLKILEEAETPDTPSLLILCVMRRFQISHD